MKSTQPNSLKAIAHALSKATDDVPIEHRKASAAYIAYGVLYGNNAIDVRQFFDDYPELIDIAELALEFDFETDLAYLDSRWRLLVSKVSSFAARIELVCST